MWCDDIAAVASATAGGRRVAFGGSDLDLVTEAVFDAFERGDFIGGFDVGSAAATGEFGIGIGADDGDGF